VSETKVSSFHLQSVTDLGPVYMKKSMGLGCLAGWHGKFSDWAQLF
jgi:hypothetical protein